MVKYSVPKSRLSQNFKNLNGVDTLLRLDKQGRCISVSIEEKLSSWLSRTAGWFVGAALILGLLHFYVVRDINVTNYITAIFVSFLLYRVMWAVREESLIMVHSLGYQVSSKCLIGQKDLFIPWNQVQSIFINEVIVRHKVIHLLTILTKGQEGEKLIPLFGELQPRLRHLEVICKHLKGANS